YPVNEAQNANRYMAGATIGQQFGGSLMTYLFAGIYGGLENTTDSRFDILTYDYIGASIGGELALTESLTDYASAALEADNYKDPEPLFLEKRSTVRVDTAVGARYAIGPGLTLGAEVAYTTADSNIVLYDYDRVVSSVSISVDF